MTGNTLEQRARELLAAEYEQDSCSFTARTILSNPERLGGDIERALCAIEAALRLSAGADGVGLIAAERQRQVSVEGWTTVHDDGHELGEMARAASCYAMPDGWRHQLVKLCWPWDATWWKPGDRIRELVKAGALVAAEIDRLQRAGTPRHEPGEVDRG